ncbi:M16 family metallopeptidase [Candidatus Cardinium hertigii]|uniref:Putative zinc protease n=1 Tax=Candidatus Cardinium hertigii TaxID=247481 RepID=A0A2Z3LE08_9BACT|nr:pitrilysin family protein [Candidatus Cardinium hertigii]AWN82272.1 putative zinc protease [Candidatus Cardinium hertigii]
MLDRSIPPKFQTIHAIDFPWPALHVLKNQLPLYLLNVGSQPIIEVELIFRGGNAYEAVPAAAYFTAAMLLEGTTNKSAQAIAQVISYYGATIDVRSETDFCSITLTTLSAHIVPMMELLLEVLLYPSFPQKSLTLFKRLKSQSIRIADKKPDRVAYKCFRAAIFPTPHSYGRFLTLQEVEAIQLEDLYNQYAKFFFAGCTIFVSGAVTPAALQCIKEQLAYLEPKEAVLSQYALQGCKVEKKVTGTTVQQLQAAIVIGKQLLVKKEADFLPMCIVNEILGGGFCSRLMQNLREDKGYTYGIYSRMVALQQAGYIAIMTEVAQSVAPKAIQEVYKEIERLQNELVSTTLLKKVKNYLLGRFLTTINDPFSIMQRFQSAYLHGLDQQYYSAFYHQVQQITPIEIRDLAQKYLSLDSLTEITVS